MIYAVYSEKQYTVVYLDEKNGTAEIKKADYNDPVSAEIKEVPAGYTFKGWGAEMVTDDMVVHAVYEKAEYTVEFKDVDDKTISSQKVTYGESALPPDVKYIKAPEGMQILGWSKDVAWWEVTGDMVVHPVITYESVSAMPYTDTDLELLYVDNDSLLPGIEAEVQTVSLLCDTSNAVIYYTLNGEDPVVSEESINETYIYKEPIEVTGSMTIKACSAAPGMDISNIFGLNIEPEILTLPSDAFGGEDVTNPNESQNPSSPGNSSTQGSASGTGNKNPNVQAPNSQKPDSSLEPNDKAKNYTPTKTSIFGKLTAKSKGFTVKWKKQKSITGYQIQYSTNRKFTKKTTKIKTIKKASTTKLTVKKLKANKKYYVRVRTYRTVKGKKYYSRWSKSKTVKTKQ